jgi:hypothetical protein
MQRSLDADCILRHWTVPGYGSQHAGLKLRSLSCPIGNVNQCKPTSTVDNQTGSFPLRHQYPQSFRLSLKRMITASEAHPINLGSQGKRQRIKQSLTLRTSIFDVLGKTSDGCGIWKLWRVHGWSPHVPLRDTFISRPRNPFLILHENHQHQRQ